MILLIFILVALITLGRFVDFLLGDQGGRRVKDRLVDYYVKIAEGDWAEIFRISAAQYKSFLDRIFGQKLLSVRFVVSVALYAFLLTLAVFATIQIYTYFSLPEDERWTLTIRPAWAVKVDQLTVLLAINSSMDLLAILFLRKMLEALPVSDGRDAFVSILLSLAVTYLAVVTAACLSHGAMLTWMLNGLLPNSGLLGSAFWNEFLKSVYTTWIPMVFSPWSYGLQRWEFSFPVALPLSIYAVILFASVVIYFSRSITQRPLSLMVERLEESKTGIFTTLASGLALIVAFLTALQKVIAQY